MQNIKYILFLYLFLYTNIDLINHFKSLTHEFGEEAREFSYVLDASFINVRRISFRIKKKHHN